MSHLSPSLNQSPLILDVAMVVSPSHALHSIMSLTAANTNKNLIIRCPYAACTGSHLYRRSSIFFAEALVEAVSASTSCGFSGRYLLRGLLTRPLIIRELFSRILFVLSMKNMKITENSREAMRSASQAKTN